MGLTLGTAAVNSYTLLLEPAFLPEANSNEGNFASSGTQRQSIEFPTYYLTPSDCGSMIPLDMSALARFDQLQRVSGRERARMSRG